MRIGLYLTGFSPDVGGGHTFQDDVFRAFVKAAHKRSDEFVVLGDHPNLPAHLASLVPPSNVQGIGLAPAGLKDRVVEEVNRSSPILKRLLRTPGRIARVAADARLDCLWYVSGGAYEPTDVPYFATVWDLQHRTLPWFPEVSGSGLWDARELRYRNFLRRASYVIVGTEAGHEEVRTFYQVPSARIRVLPHPTPRFALEGHGLTADAVRLKFSLPNSYLFYPAQFWPHKNHVNLLHALQYLRDREGKKPTLVLVGSDKSNESHVRRVVEACGLREQVIFLGFVEPQDLIGLYRGALMLVYPSMGGPENLPPLEAFALGCPVAAADLPGAREQLGEAALLFNPCDPVHIGDTIARLANDQPLQNALRERGLARAWRWTAEHFVEGVFKLFDEFAAIRRCWPQAIVRP
jgi:glycosyltransferase involved in cell wall biosynthesis